MTPLPRLLLLMLLLLWQGLTPSTVPHTAAALLLLTRRVLRIRRYCCQSQHNDPDRHKACSVTRSGKPPVGESCLGAAFPTHVVSMVISYKG